MEATTIVALAATGVTAISVVTNAWTTRWTGRNAREQQREDRQQQRLANAYVQMLELAEKEGHYLQVRKYNLEQAVWDEWGVAKHKQASRPEDEERAKSAALAAAFASPAVLKAHDQWLAAFDGAHQALEALEWKLREDYGPGMTLEQKDLQPFSDSADAEVSARKNLARSVSLDLRPSD